MPKAATKDVDADTTVDNVHEVDEFRRGEVSEDDFITSLAKRAGHTPKEEWKRDPEKWVDAKTYLERLPTELETVKERLKRTSQAAEAVIEDERRRAREQALAEVRAAATAGDPDAAVAATQRLAETAGPPPQVGAWISANPWFNEDADAADYARSVTNRLAAQGRPIAEQLEAARDAVMKRFPEHSDQGARETRLSEVRRPPVQTGTRGPSSAPRERGWSDIPSGDRIQVGKFVRAYQGRGMTEAQAQAAYAKSYWKNIGTDQ